MKNTLLIHIGTPKTGTSALQTFLADNSEKLKKQGWDFPDMLQEWEDLYGERVVKNCIQNAVLFKWASIFNWDKSKKEKIWKLLFEHLEKNNVILSDEGIWGNPRVSTVDLINEFKSRWDNIKVVCYLRRQDLYAEARWNQSVKGTLEIRDVYQYISEDESLNYRKKLDDIAAIVGKENVIVRVYEKGQFEGSRGDITSDFCQACGIRDTWEGIILPGKVNERINADVLEMNYLFNQEYKRHLDEPCYIVKRYSLKTKFGDQSCKYGYLSSDFRKEMLQKYNEDNVYIATEYMGRKDGILFKDENVDIPYYQMNFSEREKEMVKMFAEVIAELRSYIKELKQEEN